MHLKPVLLSNAADGLQAQAVLEGVAHAVVVTLSGTIYDWFL